MLKNYLLIKGFNLKQIGLVSSITQNASGFILWESFFDLLYHELAHKY